MNDLQYMEFESFVESEAELIEYQKRTSVYLDGGEEV